ncbi:MAG: hypothetical protein ABIQ74_12055 [Chitinophagales bacterium]
MRKHSFAAHIICCVTLFCFWNLISGATATSDRDTISSSSYKRGNHYFSLLPALAWNKYKDEINSPLTYHTTGFLPALEFALENRGVNHSGYTSIFISNQYMTTNEAAFTGASAEQFLTFKFNTSRCYEPSAFWDSRIHYRVGYDANFEYNHQINLRLENSAYTFAIWTTAAIANRFEFPFIIKTERNFGFIHFRKPKQHFLLNWQVNIPLFGMITRPNFAGIRHFANGEFVSNLAREMNDHIHFVSLNKFIMLHTQIELLAPLGNNNRLKIAYAWEGFRYNEDFSRVQGVISAVEVGVMFKLDSREGIW